MKAAASVPPATPAPGPGALWLAFAWGLAESTCFFIVPDVLSSRLVLQRPRLGFTACLWSLAGAMIGGVILLVAGRSPDLAAACLKAFNHLPGINPAVAEQARAGLEQDGAAALFAGFVGGIPYKLYAVQAARAGLGLPVFVAASAAARLARFVMVTAFAWLVGVRLLSNLSSRAKLWLHAGAWAAFYLGYFWRMGI